MNHLQPTNPIRHVVDIRIQVAQLFCLPQLERGIGELTKYDGGRGRSEKLNFNIFGQAISPRDSMAIFGRYIAMLARDGGLIPIDSPDRRQIDSSKLDRVLSLVQVLMQ